MKQITYIKTGDYYIPDWKLPEEHRPIGRWGRMHRDYLKEHHSVVLTNSYSPATSGPIWLTSTNRLSSEWMCWSSK